MDFALKGFLIGFAIAAPVGPIGVLCIRRTLADGRAIGLITGLGAATADMFYGAVAAFGLTVVQEAFLSQQSWLRLVGGTFLPYLGMRTFISKPSQAEAAISSARGGLLAAYLSTLALTLTNPATILSFTVIFAGLRLAETHGSYSGAVALVSGVFLGSSAWWLTLTGVVGLLRERFSSRWMVWVNRIAGMVIVAFGVTALLI